MVEASINYMDAAVICIMIISCLVAFIRGFLKEILALAGWIGAGVVTLFTYPQVGAWLYDKGYVKKEMIAAGLAFAVVFITALICFSIINRVLMKYAKSGADVGMLDNFLGLFFGGARGAFIVSLTFFLASYVLDKDQYPEFIETAKTRPYVEEGAKLLAELAPNYLKDMSSFAKDTGERLKEAKESAGSGGYNDQAREKMDQIFSNDSRLPESIDDTDTGRAAVKYQ